MKLKMFTLLVVFGLVLSACSGGGNAAATEPASSGGGTVVLILPEEPTTLNFYLADAAIVRQVADATSMTGLVTIDETGNFVPTLAQEVPTTENGGLSSDYLTVTWKLKEGLKWSDGEALTSDDVKFTVEVLSNPDSGALVGTSGFDLITKVETPDATTTVLTYSEPYPGYLDQFAYGLFPRHATGKPEEMSAWAWNSNPVVAGPFILSNWESGKRLSFTRNPNYYEAGKPYLDEVVFEVVPEPAAQTAMMLNGEAQMQLWPSEFKADYDTLLTGKAQQYLIPGIWNMAIDFNLSAPFDGDPTASAPHPILGDIRVRQAIAHAINYQSLQQDVLKGSVSDSTNPFAYGWYKCELPRQFGYDVEAANKLLDEAGWVMGDDGIRVAKGAKYAEDGTRLSLELQGYTAFDPLQLTEEFIVENLKAVGIEARIQNYDFSIIFGTFEDNSPRAVGDYDMLIFDRGFTTEPQGYNFDAYHSTRIPTAENPTGGNYFRWINAEVDSALDTAGSSFDIQTRKDAYCKVGQAVLDELPQVYLYLFQDNYGIADSLSGYTLNTWGSMSWGIQNWKFK
ncbi:MAG TPA: peptide ABC transporter substrate-binding protein [Anaerolineales bacterium]|nr:peptide ABC transporter substrate-binding protein [Anaerolineales bacterium]HMZ43489.1 peptide ABC transporter substrate-binding protein [Anaerolineales bacterium]HNA53481.1 peptide ABC transporter substrate-binding protein [Anaerolineales bacterium]HNC89414.1 peptide ABC transporter substrate-binding protein [Anaerolineales bacterium]HND93035.1 peptide ABC transporter substrate-binding protein [Anaerolineales bacterium]